MLQFRQLKHPKPCIKIQIQFQLLSQVIKHQIKPQQGLKPSTIFPPHPKNQSLMQAHSPQPVQVHQTPFSDLPQVENLQNSGQLIETYIKGHQWYDSFNCITELRKINKYHPEFVPNVIEMYGQVVFDLMSTGKTLLVKNIFRLIKELFDAGGQVNVEKAVVIFLPVLIKKAATEIGYMKTSAQEVLVSFSINCGYECSLTITAEYCLDKNAAIAELSVKLFEALVQKVGSGIMNLSQNTLVTIMKCLSMLVEGKRQNLTKQALDMCLFVCQAIGSENYLKLMQFCLKEDEVQSMGMQMQNHRTGKEKPLGIKQAIRNRKTDAFNHSFFNKQNSNFIPLAEKQMNFDNSYNTNGYYNGNNNNYSNQNGYY